jgi:hypothetical protein
MHMGARLKGFQWLLALLAALVALLVSLVMGVAVPRPQGAGQGMEGVTLGQTPALAQGALPVSAPSVQRTEHSAAPAGSEDGRGTAPGKGSTGIGGSKSDGQAGSGGMSTPAPIGHAPLYGLNIPLNGIIPVITYSQMGASWVRIEIDTNAPDHTLDDPNVLHYFQTVISQLHAAGLQVLALLDYGTLGAEYDENHGVYPWQCFLETSPPPSVNCQGFKGTAQDYDNDMAHQAGILAQLGAAAPDAYEIWNEPDNPRWYVPPQTYTGLYDAAQAAIHAVAGSGPVLTGGLNMAVDLQSPGKPGSWPSQTSVYANADAVALHPYGYVSHNYCGCYPSAGWLDNVRATWIMFLQAFHNGDAPIWFTEYNYTADPTQNNNVDRALGIQDVYSWAKANNIRVFWFNAQDELPLLPYIGIFNVDGTPAALSSPVTCGVPQATEMAVYYASAAGLC